MMQTIKTPLAGTSRPSTLRHSEDKVATSADKLQGNEHKDGNKLQKMMTWGGGNEYTYGWKKGQFTVLQTEVLRQ